MLKKGSIASLRQIVAMSKTSREESVRIPLQDFSKSGPDLFENESLSELKHDTLRYSVTDNPTPGLLLLLGLQVCQAT